MVVSAQETIMPSTGTDEDDYCTGRRGKNYANFRKRYRKRLRENSSVEGWLPDKYAVISNAKTSYVHDHYFIIELL
jgi:hypothetical protein